MLRQFLYRPLTDTRYFVLLGHLYFLVMLVLSLVYYQERLLAMDTAYYTFKVIQSGDFYTGHERTISYIPQLAPLLAMKLGWSLKAVLMAYSAGFILFYYAAYNLIVHLFKNPSAGLLLAMALGLTIRYKFYGPVGEVVLSIVPIVLLLGWLSKPDERFRHWPLWLDILVGILLSCFLLTGHPFACIGTAIGLGFILIYQKKWRNIPFWVTSIAAGGLLFLKFVAQTRNAYEAERASRLNDAWQVLTNISDYYVGDIVLWYFKVHYWLAFIVFVICLVGLYKAARRGLVWYTALSFLATLAIVIITHSYLGNNRYIMVDGYLTYLGLIWGMPLAYYWLSQKKMWQFLLITMALAFSLLRIEHTKKFFQERLTYLEMALEEYTSEEHPKAIAYSFELPHDKLWLSWAMGVETLMLSAIDGPEHTRNIYQAEKLGRFDDRLDEPGLFLSVTFGPDFIKRTDLPPQYFQLPAKPYRIIKLPKE